MSGTVSPGGRAPTGEQPPDPQLTELVEGDRRGTPYSHLDAEEQCERLDKFVEEF